MRKYFNKRFKKNLGLFFISLLFLLLIFLIYSVVEYYRLDRDVRECDSMGVFRDVCLHSRARGYLLTDEDKAWKMCYYINDPGGENECYKSIILELTKFNISKGVEWCGRIPSEKWRGECFFNLALDYANISFDKAADICEKAEVYRMFCYHDVVGAISKLSSESALRICQGLADDLARRSCFHGIGLHLCRFDESRAIGLCDMISEEASKESCYHGVGWALSEIDLEEALNICQGFDSSYRDKCLVGVAWQVVRENKAKAREICVLGGLLEGECLSHLNLEENAESD